MNVEAAVPITGCAGRRWSGAHFFQRNIMFQLANVPTRSSAVSSAGGIREAESHCEPRRVRAVPARGSKVIAASSPPIAKSRCQPACPAGGFGTFGPNRTGPGGNLGKLEHDV